MANAYKKMSEKKFNMLYIHMRSIKCNKISFAIQEVLFVDEIKGKMISREQKRSVKTSLGKIKRGRVPVEWG